jgi:hypothetical protein
MLWLFTVSGLQELDSPGSAANAGLANATETAMAASAAVSASRHRFQEKCRRTPSFAQAEARTAMRQRGRILGMTDRDIGGSFACRLVVRAS